MSLPLGSAAIRAEVLCRMWGFPNTYCLAKHLTEQMVSSTGVSFGVKHGVKWRPPPVRAEALCHKQKHCLARQVGQMRRLGGWCEHGWKAKCELWGEAGEGKQQMLQ